MFSKLQTCVSNLCHLSPKVLQLLGKLSRKEKVIYFSLPKMETPEEVMASETAALTEAPTPQSRSLQTVHPIDAPTPVPQTDENHAGTEDDAPGTGEADQTAPTTIEHVA